MPTYLDLSRKSMPSLKTTVHPLVIQYDIESQIENIKAANKNLDHYYGGKKNKR